MLEEQQPSMENQSDVTEEKETDIVEGDEDTVVNDEAAESEEESEPTPSVEDEIEQLNSEYEAKIDQMLRTVAEYENAKKRAIRDKEEFQKLVSEKDFDKWVDPKKMIGK